MNSSIAKLKPLGLLTALALFSGAASAVDYIYRDLMGNTLPSQKCSARPEAETKATDQYNVDKYAKVFCETQGYGWYVADKKDTGKLVCDECASGSGAGKYQCHLEDVVVTCKRIKPGSVGLFPGEG